MSKRPKVKKAPEPVTPKTLPIRRRQPLPEEHPLAGKRTAAYIYVCFHCNTQATAKKTGRQFGANVADAWLYQAKWMQEKGKWICPVCWTNGKRGEMPTDEDIAQRLVQSSATGNRAGGHVRPALPKSNPDNPGTGSDDQAGAAGGDSDSGTG